jgi:hypothetical protein
MSNGNPHEFINSHGLGDLPSDRGPAVLPPSRDVPGFDTTGTRRSEPGANGVSMATQGVLSALLANPTFAPLVPFLLELLKAIYRKSDFSPINFNATNVAALLLRSQEERTYVLIQNLSVADIYVGIGYQPTPTTGVLLPAGAVYEPFQVPQNEIWVLGSQAAAQAGVLLYANG